jgi:glycosyltransferase involved in cell wall biosynthesis
VRYYEPDNVQSFAAAIWQLYSQPEARCAQALRAQSFIERHGWERQGAELVAEYRALVGARH